MTTPEITVSMETVTPEQAEAWLTNNNSRNRHIRERHAQQLARKMFEGKWMPSSMISFDCHGRLLDGQHRLRAQVLAQVPATYVVQRNLPTEAQNEIDQGAKRSSSDILTLNGVGKASGTLAAALRTLKTWDLGLIDTAGSSAIAPQVGSDILDWYYEYPRADELKSWADAMSKDVGVPPSVLIVARVLQERVSTTEEVDRFWAPMDGSEGAVIPDPRATLRKWLRTNAAKGHKNGRVSRSSNLYAIVYAWNKWRAGEDCSHIRVFARKAEHDPETGEVIREQQFADMPEFK